MVTSFPVYQPVAIYPPGDMLISYLCFDESFDHSVLYTLTGIKTTLIVIVRGEWN